MSYIFYLLYMGHYMLFLYILYTLSLCIYIHISYISIFYMMYYIRYIISHTNARVDTGPSSTQQLDIENEPARNRL